MATTLFVLSSFQKGEIRKREINSADNDLDRFKYILKCQNQSFNIRKFSSFFHGANRTMDQLLPLFAGKLHSERLLEILDVLFTTDLWEFVCKIVPNQSGVGVHFNLPQTFKWNSFNRYTFEFEEMLFCFEHIDYLWKCYPNNLKSFHFHQEIDVKVPRGSKFIALPLEEIRVEQSSLITHEADGIFGVCQDVDGTKTCTKTNHYYIR